MIELDRDSGEVLAMLTGPNWLGLFATSPCAEHVSFNACCQVAGTHAHVYTDFMGIADAA